MSDILLTPDAAESCASQPFLTYVELMCRHRSLMQRLSSEGDGETQLSGVMLGDIEQFIGRVAATGALLDDENERLECQGLVNYWTTKHCRLGGTLLDLPLAAFDGELAPDLPDESYPYGRLAALQSCESGKLFGCSRLLHESLARLRDVGMLVLIGATGSGRSRFIDCVLIPALQNNEIDGSKDWRIAPTFEPGDEPLERLATAVLGAGADAASVESVARSMRNDSAALANLINERQEPLLLVIDHFEQLFTRCAPEIRLAMAANLYGAVREAEPPCRVVFMLNRRFASHVSQLRVPETDWAAAELLFSFAPHEVREAIVEPAQSVGLKFDPGLVDRLVMDVQGDPAALSLLQFQLEHLWKSRKKNRITWEAYRELGGGGLALERKAEQLYGQLNAIEQSQVREILLQLVQLDAVGDVSTETRSLSKLRANNTAARDEVLSKLTTAGLIRRTSDEDEQDPRFSVAHDALINHWPRLTGWLEEVRVANRHRLQFHQQAEDWLAAGKPTDRLWRGLQLAEARQFRRLTPVEREFIRAGHRREQLHALLRTAAVVAVALTIVAGLLGSRYIAKQEAANLLNQSVLQAIKEGDVAGATLLAEKLQDDMVQDIRAVLRAEEPSLVRVVTPGDFGPTMNSKSSFIGSMAINAPASTDNERRFYVTLRSDSGETEPSKVFANSLGFFVANAAGESGKRPTLYKSFGPSSDAEAVAVRAIGPESIVVACNQLNDGQKVAQLQWCGDASGDAAEFKPITLPDSFPEDRRFDGVNSLELSGDCLLTITCDAKKNHQLNAWCAADSLSLTPDVQLSQMQFRWRDVVNEVDKTATALKRVTQARLTGDGEWLMTVAAATSVGDQAGEPRQLSWWKRSGNVWLAVDMPQWVIDRLKESRTLFNEWGWLPKRGDAKTPPCWESLDSHILGLVIDEVGDESLGPECITCAHDGEVLFWSGGLPLQLGGSPTFQPTLHKRLDVGVSVYDAAIIDARLAEPANDPLLRQKVLATCGRDRTLRFWNVIDQDEVAPRMDHRATVERAIVLSPTGTIATLADGFVRIWKVPESLTPKVDVGENLATLSPCDHLAMPPQANNRDDLFVDATGALASGSPSLVAFDDAKPVAYSSADHRLFVKAGDEWELLPARSELCDARIKHLAYCTAKKMLAVSGSYDDDSAANRLGFTSVYAADGRHVATFHHDEEALYADFSDHDLLATCDVHNRVQIIDISQADRGTPVGDVGFKKSSVPVIKPDMLLATLEHSSDVTFASFAPHSDRGAWRIATVSSDGEARLWDATRWIEKDGDVVHIPVTMAHRAKVSTAEFDASGQFVVTASLDKTARIWRVETGGSQAAKLTGILRHPLPLDRAWFLETQNSRGGAATLPDVVTVYAASASLAEGETSPKKRYFARRWDFANPRTSDSAKARSDQLQRLAGRRVEQETQELISLSRDDLLSEKAQ